MTSQISFKVSGEMSQAFVLCRETKTKWGKLSFDTVKTPIRICHIRSPLLKGINKDVEFWVTWIIAPINITYVRFDSHGIFTFSQYTGSSCQFNQACLVVWDSSRQFVTLHGVARGIYQNVLLGTVNKQGHSWKLFWAYLLVTSR